MDITLTDAIEKNAVFHFNHTDHTRGPQMDHSKSAFRMKYLVDKCFLNTLFTNKSGFIMYVDCVVTYNDDDKIASELRDLVTECTC